MLGVDSWTRGGDSSNVVLAGGLVDDGVGEWRLDGARVGLRYRDSQAYSERTHQLGAGGQLLAQRRDDCHRKYG